MTVTAVGINTTVLDACESTTDNNMDGTDGVDFKENTYSVYATKRSSGDNDCVFTKASGTWDMSTYTHVRWWMVCSSGALINLAASGGIQLGLTDGTNTAYWYVGGRDTYPGGWYNFVCDVSAAADTGTKPTMSAITEVTIRINLTSLGKNVDNIWIDNLTVCDGLMVYGDDAGGYFDLDDIFAADDSAALGLGIVTKYGGIYYTNGKIQWGDSVSTNVCKFQAKDQILVFEDRLVNASLYEVAVIDNGTGLTEFLLGEKSGTAGVSGCTIMVEDSSQVGRVDLVATDADITNFGIYGSTIAGLDDISLPASSTLTEVLNTSFSGCGQVDPSTCTITNSNFISSTATTTGALLLDSTTFNVTYCNFITNTYGIQVTATGTYDAYGLVFTGTVTADINNTSGGSVTWANQAGTGSNAATETGDTTIQTNVTLTITVKDNADFGLLENARVILQAASGGDLPGDASVTITRVTTTASVAHTDHGLANGDVVVIEGANQGEYNGVKTISNVSTHAYDYTVTGTPTTPATGTITSSYVLINELTNASGIATEPLNYTNDQPVDGRVRLYGATKYVTGRIAGTIDDLGFATTVLLVEEI